MALTLRSNRSSNLTATEVDNNFLELSGSIADVVDGTTPAASASYALTASYALNGGGGGGLAYGTSFQYLTIDRLQVDETALIVGSTIVNDDTVGTLSVRLSGISTHIQGNDIIPTTDGIYDLGSTERKWFDGYFTNNIAIGDVNISNDVGSALFDGDIVTPALSADIANIGNINIIENTISVDVDASAEYAGNPTKLTIGTGLEVLGSTYGDKYVLVNGAGTPAENGAELQAAYDYAKDLRSSNPPSEYRNDSGYLVIDTNDRITIVVSPGEYSFPDGPFTIDTSNINIVSLTGNPDVYISTPLEPTPGNPVYASVWVKEPSTSTPYTLIQNITIKGLNTGTYQFRTGVHHPSILIENCKGGDFSFAFGLAQTYYPLHMSELNISIKAVYKNCEGGEYSFHPFTGANQCTYIDCVGGDYSFFYEIYGTNSATCIRCTAGNYSYGYFARQDIYGTYTDCIGGDFSFAGTPNGAFTPTVAGVFTNCRARTYSFGAGFNNGKDFIGCIADSNSFVSNSGTNSGRIINCIALPGASTLFASSGQGIIRNCVNANGTLINS